MFHPLMIGLKIVCMALIIAQPVYSQFHYHDVPRNEPSFGGAARFIHPLNTAHISHQVTKRQANDNTDLEQNCRLYNLDLFCSSGVAQASIDANLKCGEMEMARGFVNACGRNKMGEYCWTVYYRLTMYNSVNPDLDYAVGNCSASLASGSCDANCREQLQLLEEKLGCCSSFVIDTISYGVSANPSLWSLCGISTSPCGMPNDLSLSTAVERNCTAAELSQFYLEGLCQPGGRGQAYVNGLLENEQCSQVEDYNTIAPDVIGGCLINENGAYCGQLRPNRTVLNNVARHCDSSSSNRCNQTCASSIMEIKRLFGCCITFYNTSASSEYNSYLSTVAVSYDLWKSCGVELPGTCEGTLSGSKSLMHGGITIWVIVALMVLIQY